MTNELLLIHGGLYEGMTARKFWFDTGVAAAFTRLGFRVHAPDRVEEPRSWEEEAIHLAVELARIPSAHLLAGSNGCSPAVRLAAGKPEKIFSLILCWPATAGDPEVDAATRKRLLEAGCTPQVASSLLAGESLRGTSDTELSGLTVPVGLVAPEPPDRFHQQVTVERLLGIIPNASRLGEFPNPFSPSFQDARPEFCRAVGSFLQHL